MPAGRFPPPAAAPAAPKAPAPKVRAPRAAAPVDPLAPLTGAEIANRIAGYTASLPAPLTDAQIRTRAQGMIDPVIAGLTSRAQAQGRASAGAISGYANSLANSLASYGDSAKSIYGAAEQGQAAADAAESGAIRGTGTELASQLASKLAGLQGGPGLEAATSGVVSAAGAGGANATLGAGSAALAQLLARGTAAQNEAALQPGLARQQGLADIRDVTLSGNKTLADQIAAATGQLPGIVSGLRDQSTTRQSNRAQAALQLRQYLEGRNVDLAKFKEGERVAGLTADAKVTAATAGANAKVTAAAAKDAKPNAALSRAAGMMVDANGNYIPGPDGKPQVLPGFKVGPGGTVVKATATPAATKAASLKAANSTALSIIQKAAKVTVTTAAKGGGPFGGAGKATKKSVTPAVGSEAYYRAIHQAEAAIEPLVPADWTPAQITAFVQRLANKFFKG